MGVWEHQLSNHYTTGSVLIIKYFLVVVCSLVKIFEICVRRIQTDVAPRSLDGI